MSLEIRKTVMHASSLETADREERAEEAEKATNACLWNSIDCRKSRRGEKQQPILVFVILYNTVPQFGKLWELLYWDPLIL
mmetsp:Transcript_28845/g.29267  ORF Transcript_28845/g.29267 Transcript_28845/m.29267 type:complete len:81 (-) Transcript_28845:456-698(-)